MSRPVEACVVGASNHGKVVIRLLREAGIVPIEIFDDDETKWGSTIFDVPVVGPIEEIKTRPLRPAVLAIGDNAKRKSLADQLDLDWLTVIHPHAHVDTSAKLGRGTVILAASVVHVDAKVGEHVLINIGSCLSHDVVIEDYGHISVGAQAAGASRIGTGALLGVGASLGPRTRIGAWTVVGAGAAVIDDLPETCVAAGVPARVLRQAV